MTRKSRGARPRRFLRTDKKILRKLIQAAIDVELFTIPLYMTALYSIAGRRVTNDGFVYPSMGPTEGYALQGLESQRAYNVIFSVYIQEMLHLQLAMNIANVIGHKPKLTLPKYPGGNTIPGLGALGDINRKFKDVEVKLGPLDRNSINLFLAIELPDEKSKVPPPAVPFAKNEIPEAFGGIGNLYHSIEEYMALTYAGHGDKTLFAFCYEDAVKKASPGQIVQVNVFAGVDAYSHMTLELIPGASVALATGCVNDMINGIVSEGEGSKKNHFDFVSPSYRPDQGDAPVNALWDAYSHYARFELVAETVDKVDLWKTGWDKKKDGPWVWQELVADHLSVTRAQKKLAVLRANAWNDPSTRHDLNEILNATFSRFLDTLNKLWAGDPNATFPMDAMKAIASRVSSVWAAGGVPEFKTPEKTPGGDLHACQGLNIKPEGGKPIGQCDCSTAVSHTCSGTNDCSNQGGCGYAIVNTGKPNYYAQESPENYIPAENACALKGGCGAPIPVAQLFTQQFGPNAYGPYNGTAVWDRARNLFFEKLEDPKSKVKEDDIMTAKMPITASNVRAILPPS